jgi:hypothetical protein
MNTPMEVVGKTGSTYFAITTIPVGKSYYRVTAQNAYGLSSDYSEAVQIVNTKPTVVRLIQLIFK